MMGIIREKNLSKVHKGCVQVPVLLLTVFLQLTSSKYPIDCPSVCTVASIMFRLSKGSSPKSSPLLFIRCLLSKEKSNGVFV